MKKILYIVLIFTMASLSSCDDWLEVKPKTEILSDDLFQDEDGFNQALLGIYMGMTDTEAYGENLSWHMLEILAQQYVVSSGSYLRYAEYNYEAVSGKKQVWGNLYNAISQANKVLEMVGRNKDLLSTPAYNVIKGEALALRAFCHFDLLRLYAHGNLVERPELLSELTIPYVLEHGKEITPQKSYEETFALLEADLTEALKCLEYDRYYMGDIERADDYEFLTDPDERPLFSLRKQRLNALAAQALQARVYLWEGKKAEALAAAEKAILFIDRAGFTWASDIPTLGRIFTSEHLFELDAVKLQESLETFYDVYILGGSGSPNPNILKQHSDFVEGIFSYQNDGEGASDLRYVKQYESITIEAEEFFLTKKLYTNTAPGSLERFNTRIPMIKMSEAYLIAIECYANGETPDLVKAVEYLNLLKEKKKIRPEFYIDPAANIDDVNEAVFKEYRKEFPMEGQLFYYYKRLGLSSFPGLDNEIGDAQYMLPYPDAEIDLGFREN